MNIGVFLYKAFIGVFLYKAFNEKCYFITLTVVVIWTIW